LKQNKTPLPLRIIPVVFPWIEKFAPWVADRFFIYLFFTPMKYRTPEKEKKAESFSEQFTIRVLEKNIQCYRWGNADKTVLVIHGWAGRATQFRRFVKPLMKAGYQVVGFDGPAHGKSDGKSTNPPEFRAVIVALVSRLGNVSAIVTHSFGGVTALYAIANNLPVKTLVNIASPTIGEEIINTYRRAIGASAKTGEAVKRYVLKKTGKPFQEFTALEFIKYVPPDLNLLLVHDEDDSDVFIEHPKALMKVYPQAELIQTRGLGHTRILKDDNVINRVVTFITHHSSNSSKS
jgi:pimeloyl-ACP methyl ester carboxylesterase